MLLDLLQGVAVQSNSMEMQHQPFSKEWQFRVTHGGVVPTLVRVVGQNDRSTFQGTLSSDCPQLLNVPLKRDFPALGSNNFGAIYMHLMLAAPPKKY